MTIRASVLIVAAVLAACTHAPRKGDSWPTLAPRPGEAMAAAPGCGGCGPDATTVAPPVPERSAQPLRTLPADAEARLAAIDAALKPVEAKLSAQAAATRRALAAAKGHGENDDATIAAEVQRTRLEALTLPLPELQERLDTLSAEIAGIDGAEALGARIAGLATRITAAQATGSL